MTSDLTVVDITTRAGLPDAHVRVMQALHQLGEIVPTSRWCLIGGLMVEVLLASRDGMMLRPTYDGDIVGDVVADRSALRKLAHALLDLGFDEKPTGWDGDIGVRFRHPVSHVYIDVLMPELVEVAQRPPGATTEAIARGTGNGLRDRDCYRLRCHVRGRPPTTRRSRSVRLRSVIREGVSVEADQERKRPEQAPAGRGGAADRRDPPRADRCSEGVHEATGVAR